MSLFVEHVVTVEQAWSKCGWFTVYRADMIDTETLPKSGISKMNNSLVWRQRQRMLEYGRVCDSTRKPSVAVNKFLLKEQNLLLARVRNSRSSFLLLRFGQGWIQVVWSAVVLLLWSTEDVTTQSYRSYKYIVTHKQVRWAWLMAYRESHLVFKLERGSAWGWQR